MFKQFDIFGSQINLRFNGQQTHKTNLGSLISIMIAIFIIYRLITIIIDVVQRKNPQVMYNERQVDNPALFSIDSKYFPIAFAMEDPVSNIYYIDESIYTVQVQWEQRVQVFNSTTQQYDVRWEVQNIDVKRCTLENFQNLDNQNYYLKLNYTNMYCLPPDYNIKIQGDFPSPIYSQLSLKIQRCQINCNTPEQIEYYLKKSFFGMLISDAYVDPTIKDYPFKIYSKDLFWSTSSQMPKDVNVFIRNNYVQSDFGWFFSDVKTQIFPSYSYYEDSVFPEDFQDYFLQITFRFEKQKESLYLRNYPDFNSIITQIGGFTQSLLAIGYLICRTFSQLRLNQSIVNQIFKYDDQEQKIKKNVVIQEQQVNKTEIISKKQIKQLGNHPQSSQNIVIKRQKRNLTQIISTNKKNLYESNSSLNQDLEKSKVKNISDDQNNSYSIKNNCKVKVGGFSEYSKQQLDFINSSDILNLKQLNEQKDQKQMLNQILQNDLNSELNISNHNSMGIIKSALPQKILKKQPTQKQLKKAVENHFECMFKQQTKSIHVSIWEYIKSSIFPCKSQKKKKDIINYSFEMLYQNLDILQILKRLIEVEKLKRLFLNQEQLKLFDYLPKPTIHSGLFDKKTTDKGIQNQYEINLLYQDNRTELQRAKDAYDSYKKILSKNEYTELDEKLINMLDQNLIDIFEAQSDSNSPSINQIDELNQVSILQEKTQNKNINQNVDLKTSIKIKNQSHNTIQYPELKLDKLICQQFQQLNLSNFCNQSQKKEFSLNADQSIQSETTNQEEVAQERMYCRELPQQNCNLNISSK
ncbi:hypothetical protein ABPG74_018234 [Tetrahymena malaccensis]